MNKILFFTLLLLGGISLAACSGDKTSAEAKAIYGRAQKAMDEKHYAQARAGVDSINKLYTTAFDVRNNAIILKNEIILKESQDSLQRADSLLQVARTKGSPRQVVLMRQRHFDSLMIKVRFYIKKLEKMKNLKAHEDAANN